MLIVRCRVGDATRYGALEGNTVIEYAGTPWTTFRRGRKRHSLHQVVLLAPALPSKIVAVGSNYRARAAELAEALPDLPVLALKPPSAVIGPDDPIVLPPQSDFVEHEAELAIVLERRCHKVSPVRARDYVLGYTALNDVTARDVRARDGLAARAKGFDTFCPLGSTKDLIFPVEDLVARVSEVMTLLPGDRVEIRVEGVGSLKNPVVKL